VAQGLHSFPRLAFRCKRGECDADFGLREPGTGNLRSSSMRTTRKMLTGVATGVLGISLGVLALCDVVQAGRACAASQNTMRFETVSIHPHKLTGDDPSNRQMLPGGRFVATATTVKTLLRVAFRTDDNQMGGVPGWASDELFDINGVVENRAEIKSPEQFQQLLLSLLEERFALKYHRESEEATVYRLELNKAGRPGAGLKPSDPDEKPSMVTNSNGVVTTMRVTDASMADVAAALRRQAGRPVEDHTGLQGKYDFEIRWSNDETADSQAPPLITVLKEQLGLRLTSAKGTTEKIVVDTISQPSPN
jgi:uncharacterized protein (TIGR03435 family)